MRNIPLNSYLVSVLMLCALNCNLPAQEILINEVMAKNCNAIADSDGDYSDWIELYNNGDTNINLKGYYLSDKESAGNRCTLPEIIISAKGYVIIFASGKNIYCNNEIHSEFKISSSGETIYLWDPEGGLIDRFETGGLEDNCSVGRYPDGSDNLVVFRKSSPAVANDNNNIYFSHAAGYYSEPFYLELTGLNPNDPIYYTLDGSSPCTGSLLYTGPVLIEDRSPLPNYFSEIPTTPLDIVETLKNWKAPKNLVDKATIIRCASFRNGIQTSDVYSRTFFVIEDIFGKYDFPTISILTDSVNFFGSDSGIYVPGDKYNKDNPFWSGNYYKRGEAWERPIHIEIFDTEGLTLISQQAGVRMHGGASRVLAQKTLRIYAKNEYGKEEFEYPMLQQTGQKAHKRFLIRSFLSSWHRTGISDIAAREIVKDMNFDCQSWQPVIVFINGEYWGIQYITERIDKYFLHYKHNVDRDELDLLDAAFEVQEGSNSDFLELLEFVEENDLAEDEKYNFVCSQIDIMNFIEYYIAEIYLQNYDWPGNNVLIWRPHEQGGKWKWIMYDMDAAFGDYNFNMLKFATEDEGPKWPNPPRSTLLFRKLLENDNFKNNFIERFAWHLENTFDSAKVLGTVHNIKSLFEDEIDKHIARWSYPSSIEDWNSDIETYIFNFVKNRPAKMKKHLIEFFGLDASYFDSTNTSTPVVPEGPKENIILKLYPNPAANAINISFNNPLLLQYDLKIFNSLGAEIMTMNNISAANSSLRLDVSFLPEGMYFIRIKSGPEDYSALLNVVR